VVGGRLLRHHLGVPETTWGSSRGWTWLSLSGVVFFSYQFVGNLRGGEVWGVVVYELWVLSAISIVVRSLVPERVPERRRLTNVAGVVGGLAFATISILLAVRLTTGAVQGSGGHRVLFAIGAVLTYLFTALMLFGVILSLRPRSCDAATTETNENRA